MEHLKQSQEITDTDEWTGKFTFYLKNAKYVAFQITTKGKLSITYPEGENYNDFLPQIKPLLVKKGGTQAEILYVIRNPDETKQVLVEEADPKEVLDHLRILNEQEKPEVLQFRLGLLSSLAGPKRIAHIPNVLEFCEDALQDPKYQDKRVLKELCSLLRKILHFERFRNPPNCQQTIERISGKPLQYMLKMMETETDFGVTSEMIYLVGETDKEESVKALFKMIERISEELYEKLKPRIFQVLFQKGWPLHDAQNERINQDIDKLLKSTDQKIRERGRELSYEKRSSKYNY